MKTLLPVLLILTPSLCLAGGQRKPDRLQDCLAGDVKAVVETYSQSECKAPGEGSFVGSVRGISYDREGDKATEAFDLYSCDYPVIHYSREPDGTVFTYEEFGRCRSQPIRVPVYRITREYDSAGYVLREVTYLEDSIVWRSEYTRDAKGRLVKKTTLHAAQPHAFDRRFKVAQPSTFKPFTIEEIYKYGAGHFPEKVTVLRDGKTTWSYTFQYEYDSRGNWIKRVELGEAHKSRGGGTPVTCRKLTYY